MVSLLGSNDEILQARSSGRSPATSTSAATRSPSPATPADNAMAERIFAELLELIEKGETLTADAVRRTVGMLEQGTAERPAEVLTLNILSRRGRTIRPKTLGQKRYVDSIDQHTIVFGIGPAGTGKTYLAMAKAVQALQAKQVNRIILTRPGGRGGRAAGLPARHAVREDRPVPAAALRRAARHDRPGLDPAADGQRHDRGRAAGVHARPHPQRRVHHPGRGAEHHARADEDVPDPARLRLQDRGDRRHHPGRPARRHPQRPAGRPGHPRRRGGRALRPAHQRRRGAAPAGQRHRRRVRAVGRRAGGRRRPSRCRARAAARGGATAQAAQPAGGDADQPRGLPTCPSRSPTSPVPTSTPTPCSTVARYALDEMGVNPLAELSRPAGRRRRTWPS